MATDSSNTKVEDQSDNNNVAEIKTAEPDSIKVEFQAKAENESNGTTDAKNDEMIKADVSGSADNVDENDDNDDDDVGADDDAKSEDDSEKTNLIVNYLPQNMTDEDFKALFAKFGEMKSCKIVRNKMTGYSYGFGFVDFETHEQAIKAIEDLNGHELDTKKIKVAFARPAGQDIKQANLYVKNIPLSWTQDDVRKAFESYGNIIQVRVLGDNRGIAFVLYDLRKQAEEALEGMQGKKFEGSTEPLEINFAADKKSDKKKGGRRGRGGNSDGGRTRERNNRGSGSMNRSNRNRSQSDSRQRSQQQGQRSMSNQRGGRNQNNDSYNSGGFGPMRQNPQNRQHRFAPFAPVQQQPAAMAAQPQPQPMAMAYGYPAAQQQAMYNPYMMQPQQQQMMQLSAATGQPMAAAYTMSGAYQMAPAAQQMAPMGYGSTQMSASASAQTMSNMYNMASNTLQNAAQMQPQLGQPMNNQMRGGQGTNQSTGNSSSGPQDGITLFVYNIGPQSDESELRSMFAPYGQVLRCNVVRKTPGGETKGFGFVTLKERNQANAAISALNGSPRNGKTLQVSFKK